jgi:hypothetical protein
MATSVDTADGSWATVPMGHLDQPLDTFWQLFFRPSGSTKWSDQVQAAATATNGGLVLAAAGGSLTVGVRPSDLLTFSPVISTSTGGRSWSNGLISRGLSANPGALAVDPAGQALAWVRDGAATTILASTRGLSSWQVLTTQKALASSAAGQACSISSLGAVSYLGGSALIGAACARPGTVGIFQAHGGGWQLAGPALPPALASDTVEVLALHSAGQGVSALLGLSDSSGTSLAAAWKSGSASPWTVSAPLPLSGSQQISSTGSAVGRGVFVLLTDSSGAQSLEVVTGPHGPWTTMPSPPPRTATVSFSPGAPVAALAVSSTVLTVWELPANASSWTQGQVLTVPIQFGSSG